MPADEPLADGPAVPGATREFVAVTITTQDGLEGIGVTFFGGALTRALKAAVDGLGALIVNDDPLQTETVYESSTFVAGIVVALVITPTICSVMRESFSQAPIGERVGPRVVPKR